MCVDQFGKTGPGGFDPRHCPLLQGLSPEEADRMMASDPRIRACRAAVESGRIDAETCMAKLGRAEGRRAARNRVA